MLAGKNIVVGISGGIAAYKACDLVSRLVQRGAQVHVIMTRNATEFVGPLTFQTLSARKVVVDLFEEVSEFDVQHVSVSDAADCFVIAPATANIIGKIANGIADDALSATVMAAACPVLLAPAMNTRMWENPITQENLARLRERGYRIIPPETGWLACGYEGIGRLAPVTEIISFVETAASGRTLDLAGCKVIITAGPTRETIDTVRFLSNPSTGKMGYALARAAVARGAQVTLISGPASLDDPLGAQCVRVTSAQEMYEAVMAAVADADIVIGAAAVADFTPRQARAGKLNKSEVQVDRLELVHTPDILEALGRQDKPGRMLVGFAAETEDLLAKARQKLREKNLDLMVANDLAQPGAGFGADTNIVTLVRPNGEALPLGKMPKREVAERIFDEVVLQRQSAEVQAAK